MERDSLLRMILGELKAIRRRLADIRSYAASDAVAHAGLEVT